MLITAVTLLSSLAAHPHACAPCDAAAPPSRQPVHVIAEDKTFPQQLSAWAIDGPQASHLNFYAETGGGRLQITADRAMELTGNASVKAKLDRANRWTTRLNQSEIDLPFEAALRPLGLAPETLDVIWATQDVATTVAFPPFWVMPLQNSAALWLLAPTDEELRRAPGVRVRSSPSN